MRRIVIAFFLILSLGLNGCGNKNNEDKMSQSNNQNIQGTSTNKEFTAEELKKYDGQNGNPAYVAVDGIVYDVTNVKKWRNGKHESVTAGNDLSKQITSSPHGKNILKEIPIVGKLK